MATSAENGPQYSGWHGKMPRSQSLQRPLRPWWFLPKESAAGPGAEAEEGSEEGKAAEGTLWTHQTQASCGSEDLQQASNKTKGSLNTCSIRMSFFRRHFSSILASISLNLRIVIRSKHRETFYYSLFHQHGPSLKYLFFLNTVKGLFKAITGAFVTLWGLMSEGRITRVQNPNPDFSWRTMPPINPRECLMQIISAWPRSARII